MEAQQKSDGTYKATHIISGLDYNISYNFQCAAQDAVTTKNSGTYTARALPVFDWGKDDFRFNVPVCLQNGALLNNFESKYINTDINNLTEIGSFRVAADTANFPIAIVIALGFFVWTIYKQSVVREEKLM